MDLKKRKLLQSLHSDSDQILQIELLDKYLKSSKKDLENVKRRMRIAYQANDKNRYLLKIEYQDKQEKYNNYNDKYNELILIKTLGSEKKKRQDLKRYMSMYNKGNRVTHKVKLIPEKQIFMHSCMIASVSFWGADARRRFDETLLSATKDRTGDFKLYEQCLHKIIEENGGVIKDGYTEFNKFGTK